MKVGLKLWSTNAQYIKPAQVLFDKNLYNYIELFVVPDSLSNLRQWAEINIPFVLHAPHSYAGLNLARSECKSKNLRLFNQVHEYLVALHPLFVIVHPGMSGTIDETIHQLLYLQKQLPDLTEYMLIENKPKTGLKNEQCVGYSFEEIEQVINNVGIGFCLDFGHAIAMAFSEKKSWPVCINSFMSLSPKLYHLCDGFNDSPLDQHLHLGAGDYDLKKLTGLIPSDAMVSLETPKNSERDLNDFENDIQWMRKNLL